jgi:hypothetical protein
VVGFPTVICGRKKHHADLGRQRPQKGLWQDSQLLPGLHVRAVWQLGAGRWLLIAGCGALKVGLLWTAAGCLLSSV